MNLQVVYGMGMVVQISMWCDSNEFGVYESGVVTINTTSFTFDGLDVIDATGTKIVTGDTEGRIFVGWIKVTGPSGEGYHHIDPRIKGKTGFKDYSRAMVKSKNPLESMALVGMMLEEHGLLHDDD